MVELLFSKGGGYIFFKTEKKVASFPSLGRKERSGAYRANEGNHTPFAKFSIGEGRDSGDNYLSSWVGYGRYSSLVTA